MARHLASIVTSALLLPSASDVRAQHLRVYYTDIDQGNSTLVVRCN